MMTTTTGIAVFMALILGGIGVIAWLSAVSFKQGKKLGRGEVTTEEAEELLAIAAAKQEAERELEEQIADHPLRRASDRLRQSKWNRDS